MARCGESGLIFITLAVRQYGAPANSAAQASAPTKLGILPSTPGKRATRFPFKLFHTARRMSSLVFMAAKINRNSAYTKDHYKADLSSCEPIRRSILSGSLRPSVAFRHAGGGRLID